LYECWKARRKTEVISFWYGDKKQSKAVRPSVLESSKSNSSSGLSLSLFTGKKPMLGVASVVLAN
jgi:hypothetical protein